MTSDYMKVVAQNGTLMERDEVRVSPLSDAFMFGRGLFESVRVHGGRAVFLRDHHARLKRSCDELGLAWSVEESELARRCAEVVRANQAPDSALKILVYAEDGRAGELVAVRPYAYTPEHYRRGFRLTVEHTSFGALSTSGKKTISYLPYLLAREKAQAAGFDEALLVGASERVLEGSATNVFAVLAGEIYTPALKEGVLPGIARQQIVSRYLKPSPNEGRLTIEMLNAADEVFVTNALVGVMPVSAIDDRAFNLAANPVTRRLMDEYASWMREG